MQDSNIVPLDKYGVLVLSQDLIDEFLAYLQKKGRASETVTAYRSHLNRMLDFLPEDHEIRHGTLDVYWEKMQNEGYSSSSINVAISVANSLFEYCGHRELQIAKRKKKESVSPKMTRAEYLRLLQSAKRLGKEETYLLVKVIGCTGVSLSELKDVTAEAVRVGTVMVENKEGDKTLVAIPGFLCDELENYMERQNILYGSIFAGRNGQPLSRSTVAQMIAELSKDAHVSRNKCNVRCLRTLCNETKKLVMDNMLLQMQQMYESLLEQEQQMVGWTSRTNMYTLQNDTETERIDSSCCK